MDPHLSVLAPADSSRVVFCTDIVEQLMDLYKTARQRAEEDAKKKAATSVPRKVTGPPVLPVTAT